jgi:hypothetical protein
MKTQAASWLPGIPDTFQLFCQLNTNETRWRLGAACRCTLVTVIALAKALPALAATNAKQATHTETHWLARVIFKFGLGKATSEVQIRAQILIRQTVTFHYRM